MYKRTIFQLVKERLSEPRQHIQVLLGPRQVGKTTLATQVVEELDFEKRYVSADQATLEEKTWLSSQWEMARQLAKTGQETILIIDEIQKIPQWSDLIKQLWDEDTQQKLPLKILLLGSSPWSIQKGIYESLAGRFEIIPMTHWTFAEMRSAFSLSLEEYIFFGGYPGSAHLINQDDCTRWKNYINDSLIETTLSRDIMLMTQINKPALLRKLFQLGALYSGQVLSYQKMTGQLQDSGNTTTLAHYLELLGSAGLLIGLQKFANQPVRKKGSSPRFMVFNTALLSAQTHFDFQAAQKDPSFWGHLVESSIGSYLLNSIRGKDIQLFYWREGNKEVDFVLQKGEQLIALEVKSGKKKETLSGIAAFQKQFNPYKTLLIGQKGIPVETFLTSPIECWFD